MHEDKEPPKGLRILVVNDNRDAATMLAILLELEGHRAHAVHSGLDAIREASRARYDVVLLDLEMPVMNGFQAADILGQLRPAPVLVACSAWDDVRTRRYARDLGFCAHLRKPVRIEVLQSLLRRVHPAKQDQSDSA